MTNVMDERSNYLAANRARRASLTCISRGVPNATHRLPGKPTDVATRRRLSMTTSTAADLDCPGFLRNGFNVNHAAAAAAAASTTTRSNSPVRGVRRTASGLQQQQPSASRRSSHHVKSSSHPRSTANALQGNSATSTSNGRHESRRHGATKSSSHHDGVAQLLTKHLSHRNNNSSRRSRLHRSASMSSIASGAAKGCTAVAAKPISASSVSPSNRGRRRNSMLAAAERGSSLHQDAPTMRGTVSTKSNTPEIVPKTSYLYEFDDDNDDVDVEEFAGDNVPEEKAWLSPFEANPETQDDNADTNSAAIVQKLRRLERQRMRNPAAAAASTVLNTRRGRAPERAAKPSLPLETTTTATKTSAAAAALLLEPAATPPKRSRSVQPPSSHATTKTMLQTTGDSNTDPHVRRDSSTLFTSMAFGIIPWTEPKKEILFTPTPQRKSVVTLSPSDHGEQAAALFSDNILTPSLHRRTLAQKQAPVSACAALGAKSLLMRSKSLDGVGTINDFLVPSLQSPSSSAAASPQTPFTATSPGSKHSKTLSNRSSRSTVSTSSRDSKTSSSGSKEGLTLATRRRESSGAAHATPRSSKTPIPRAKSMDQYTTRDFLMLSPLSAMSNNRSKALVPALSSPNSAASPTVAFDTDEPPLSKINKLSSSHEHLSLKHELSFDQQDDPSTTTTSASSSDKNTSPKVPRVTNSSRSCRSRRASTGEDGQLHRHMRRSSKSDDAQPTTCQQPSVATAARQRRRQSLSHAPASAGAATSMPRNSRRVSMSSGAAAVDGNVTAVVTTMTRMTKQSPANASDVHMMNW
ncbi:hypothetical protein MPSEU_000401800 [Mayamaea pseudoterrestris]|nr:hypothetical protein MPSEU_000401800 [Mayamaea pseudoterrestris]